MIPNCIILNPNDSLVKEIQAVFPNKSFKVIKVEVGTLLTKMIEEGRSDGSVLPSIAEYKKAYPVLEEDSITEDKVITFTPTGQKQQTYTIKKVKNGEYQIINKDGKEVFAKGSRDRNRIFANLAVKEGRAVIVNHKGVDYVVNLKGDIITTAKSNAGAIMNWSEDNGDRKEIIRKAKEEFKTLSTIELNQPLNTTNSKQDLIDLDNIYTAPITRFRKAAPRNELKYSPQDNTREYVDYSILQERMNREFQDSQKKANRVNMIARTASQAITNLYNRHLERCKAENIEPISRQQFAASKIADILFGKNEELSPLQKLISSGRNVREDDPNREYKISEYNKLSNPVIWRMLVQEASNILFTTEGISIDIVNEQVSTKNVQNQSDETDVDNSNRDDGESKEAIKDGWMVKAREVDVRDTLSQETRKILNELKRIDRNGNIILDDIGQPMYLNPDDAHLVLLEACSNITRSSEFIPTLEKLTTKYSWVQQVVNIIKEDQKNRFWTITPKLYHDLRKEFVPYYVQAANKEGVIITKQVNKTPSVSYLLDKWRANFEAGIILNQSSIYDEIGNFNKDNAKKGINGVEYINKALTNKTRSEYIDFINENIDKFNVLLNMIGIEFSNEEILDTLSYNNDVINNTTKLLSSLNIIFSEVSKNDYKRGTDFINEFSGAFNEIAKLFNSVPEGSVIASFREAGKTRQSYSPPSFIGNLISRFKGTFDTVQEFLNAEYKQYKQFYVDNKYNSYWLRCLASDNDRYRDLLSRKVVIHREGIEFDDWNSDDYLKVILQEFFDSPNDAVGKTAYYALPLLADAPSSEFIKFERIVDDPLEGNAKDRIIELLAEEAWNEYQRILLINSRKEANKNDANKAIPIANFDTLGDKFLFFPFLNVINLNDLSQYSKADILELFKKMIRENEDSSFQEFLNEHKVKTISLDSSGNEIVSSTNIMDKTDAELENFFYNNALAYINIVRLTTTDLAYYKGQNDFQKRYKEVYAMTNRMYYDPSFGFSKNRKVVSAKDIEFKAQPYEEMSECLDYAIEKGYFKGNKESILSQYEKVNATDAQGLVTLNAVKKVMMMTGNWTEKHEDAKLRIEGKKEGGFKEDDFKLLYETAKPFMFTHTSIQSDSSIKDSNGNIENYGNLKVPMQFKNSEFVLLAIYGSIASSLSNSPILKGITNWMVNNDIDLFQFESGIKVGNQSPIDLNGLTTEDDVASALNASLNFPNTIKEVDWEDYGIQSATPEHLVDHEALIGSQAKKLITADLHEDLRIKLSDLSLNPSAIHSVLDMAMACGYIDGYMDCEKIFSSKESLSEALLKEMDGNSRYTDEERFACTINKNTGDFNIPLHDPIQANRVEQLLNGIIKKKVTKQQITGGSVTQVSNFGVSEDLRVRYNDANGNLIFTENEWNDTTLVASQRDRNRLLKLKERYKSFNDYRAKYKAVAMAYFEAYLPAYTKKFFNKLGRTEGNFNIEDLPEELRYCIGYRIPTESKYSMQKIYIKGFLPQQNGSAIMLPSEITTIVGSDFDIKIMG